jgi:hypothetical protein
LRPPWSLCVSSPAFTPDWVDGAEAERVGSQESASAPGVLFSGNWHRCSRHGSHSRGSSDCVSGLGLFACLFWWHHLRGLVLSVCDTLSPSAPIANKTSAYAPPALPTHMRPTHKGSSPAGTACPHICRAHTRSSSGEFATHAVLTSVTTVPSWSRGDPGLFGGVDLGELRARVNQRDQLTSLHRAHGVLVCLLPTVVIVLELRHRETMTSTPPVLISNCISCVLPDRWLVGRCDLSIHETTTRLLSGGPRASP